MIKIYCNLGPLIHADDGSALRELCSIVLFRSTFSAFDSHMYGWTPVPFLSVMLLLPAVYRCRYTMQRDVYAMPSSGDGREYSAHLHTLQISSFLDTSQKWHLDDMTRRRTGLLPSGPKSSFQMRASFVFHLETKVLESWGRVEKLIAQVAWSPVLSFQSVMIWGQCHLLVLVHCVFLNQRHCTIYQDILEHFMLPSADQLFKDADFIFQHNMAPVHTAKSTKSWLNDHGVGVLDWSANSPDLNIENIWDIVKMKMRNKRPKNADELKATVKETCASHHLSSATNWSPPCHAELRQ